MGFEMSPQTEGMGFMYGFHVRIHGSVTGVGATRERKVESSSRTQRDG